MLFLPINAACFVGGYNVGQGALGVLVDLVHMVMLHLLVFIVILPDSGAE